MAKQIEHHEFRSHQDIKSSSDRSFGLVFAGAFALLAAWNFHKHGALWPLYLPIAAVSAALALLSPGVLAPANRAWTKLGLLLGRLVNPIVMGVIFFAVFAPIAAFLRSRGKDPLSLKFDRAGSSYWVDREPPGSAAAGSMKNQF